MAHPRLDRDQADDVARVSRYASQECSALREGLTAIEELYDQVVGAVGSGGASLFSTVRIITRSMRYEYSREERLMTTAARAPRLADWALSHGRSAFSTSDLAGILGVPPAQVSERLSAPLARHEWCTPARGLWVPVPPEYRAWALRPGSRLSRH